MQNILNIKRGDAPLSPLAIRDARDQYMNRRGYNSAYRDKINSLQGLVISQMATPEQTAEFMKAVQDQQQLEADLEEVASINTFNAQLVSYRAAVARLARVPLATGLPALMEDQPTGELDDDGNPILAPVEVAKAIPPAPAEIRVPKVDDETGEVISPLEYDDETGEVIGGGVLVPNPAIAKDEAERAAAQAVIDGTPQEVIGFVAG